MLSHTQHYIYLLFCRYSVEFVWKHPAFPYKQDEIISASYNYARLSGLDRQQSIASMYLKQADACVSDDEVKKLTAPPKRTNSRKKTSKTSSIPTPPINNDNTHIPPTTTKTDTQTLVKSRLRPRANSSNTTKTSATTPVTLTNSDDEQSGEDEYDDNDDSEMTYSPPIVKVEAKPAKSILPNKSSKLLLFSIQITYIKWLHIVRPLNLFKLNGDSTKMCVFALRTRQYITFKSLV